MLWESDFVVFAIESENFTNSPKRRHKVIRPHQHYELPALEHHSPSPAIAAALFRSVVVIGAPLLSCRA